MTLNIRKYAALPDLDEGRDTYETQPTPSLTDDNGTEGRTRSSSTSSHSTEFQSTYGSEPSSPTISKRRLRPDDARALFEPARISADGAHFGDRITKKKHGYKSSKRKGDIYGDVDEDEESLEQRVARIKREIEEVRELSRRQDGEAQGDDKEDEAEALSKLLDGLETRGKLPAPAANLQASLATPLPPSSIPPTFDSADSKPAIDAAATYTVSYAPNYSTSHTLALTTSFESRLHAVESALGLPQTLSSAPSPPLLSTLDQMAKKLALLTTMTPAQVDALSRRVRALTAESERLAAAKLAARQSGLSGDSTESEGGEAKSEVDEEAKGEQEARINALYGTLSTIETLSPLLPGVLERLRSLRQVHSGAAEVKQELDEAMRKQQEMEKEIGRWREGLEKVEKAVVEAEKTGGENVKAVEGWVRELEEKVKSLDS